MGKPSDFLLYVCQNLLQSYWMTKLHAVCFFAIVPLARLLDYGGEQMVFYLGKDLGDLVKVTLSKCGQQIYAVRFTSSFYNSAVEATLAIMLLHQCESVFLFSISSFTPTPHFLGYGSSNLQSLVRGGHNVVRTAVTKALLKAS